MEERGGEMVYENKSLRARFLPVKLSGVFASGVKFAFNLVINRVERELWPLFCGGDIDDEPLIVLLVHCSYPSFDWISHHFLVSSQIVTTHEIDESVGFPEPIEGIV